MSKLSNQKEVLLTQEGLREIKEELEDIKTRKRREVAERLKEAIAQGDLSENAEYDAAKEEQAFIEARVGVLESMIRNAKMIDPKKGDRNSVDLGSKVTIQELPDGGEETYTIVGSAESDPDAGRISNESPLGAELLGRRPEEIINVAAPAGMLSFKVLKIG
ncbi:transcription elongation factor GreA [Pasteuria penetrans]|uniref:transcription elongation factor GreA n=1 Tax=Pasteuria penetrans TaxID=86005 RepID=UPI000F9D4E81|nr:transcription elongation factor GreA [Pasteuria penetrans]